MSLVLSPTCAFQELRIEMVSATELLEKALRIAMLCERTAYDSLYIALSVREQCIYLTADEKLMSCGLGSGRCSYVGHSFSTVG